MNTPDFKQSLKDELKDWRRWSDRLVVLFFAVLTGLVIVLFTKLSEDALNLFFKIASLAWWLPLILTPCLTALIVYLTRKYAATAAGSGIPQVMAALSSQTPRKYRSIYVSVKLSLSKILLTTMGLLGGLSLGREGPSVQIAAGIMHTARRWLSKNSQIRESGLMLAGGAAGIAAAFNTPLGGVMFAIEELSKHPEDRRNGVLLSAIILAGMVSVSIYGNATYFGVIHVQDIGFSLMIPALVVAIVCGVLGGIFSKIMIRSLNSDSEHRVQQFRSKRPVVFAFICGLAIAVIGIFTAGATFGSGYAHSKAMLENHADVLMSYAFLKIIATWLTTWSGVPGGIFAPSLAIGGALGNDLALLLNYVNAPTLIALGMAGFLAAVTQAPLTSFIIVMEMVSGHELVLSLMTSALIASAISRLISYPLYSALTQYQLKLLSFIGNDCR